MSYVFSRPRYSSLTVLLKASCGVLVVDPILVLVSSALFVQIAVAFIARFCLMGVLSALGRASLACRLVLVFPLSSMARGRVSQLSGIARLASFPIASLSGWLGSRGIGMVVQVVNLQLSRVAVVRNCLVSDGVFRTIVTRASLLCAVSVET